MWRTRSRKSVPRAPRLGHYKSRNGRLPIQVTTFAKDRGDSSGRIRDPGNELVAGEKHGRLRRETEVQEPHKNRATRENRAAISRPQARLRLYQSALSGLEQKARVPTRSTRSDQHPPTPQEANPVQSQAYPSEGIVRLPTANYGPGPRKWPDGKPENRMLLPGYDQTAIGHFYHSAISRGSKKLIGSQGGLTCSCPRARGHFKS